MCGHSIKVDNYCEWKQVYQCIFVKMETQLPCIELEKKEKSQIGHMM